MRVACIGGGPAGLYAAILLKKRFPDADIQVFERNRADDTFGWGVVFSDETLAGFRDADPESFADIKAAFAWWTDIDTHYGGTCVTSTGHGFCGLARVRLLKILQQRCAALGVALAYETEVHDLAPHLSADLVIAADGLNSAVRERHAEHFRPSIHWGSTRFCWLGTTRPLRSFTFDFRTNEHGLFQLHAYPFQADRSTWIVECPEETWARAGFEGGTEQQTVDYCRELYADLLDGHPLLTNRSIWRSFPTVHNETWYRCAEGANIVLLGDAAHTAHFSIGSGTKLAMEDAIALDRALGEHGPDAIPAALAAYQDARWVDVAKLQKTAKTSRTWFENVEPYMTQHPLQFSFNLMSRSKAITYDNLSVRDPALMRRVTEWWWDSEARAPRARDGSAPPPMFAPFTLRAPGGSLELVNRMVVSPMCQYSAVDGTVGDWHLAHLGALAVGGAGLLFTEMTDVSETGRITHGCAGMYAEEHVAAWKRIVDFVHAHSRAKIGQQLAHAGRKGSCHLPWEGDDPLRDATAWQTLGPSAEPFDTGWPAPRAMTRADMDAVRDDFVAAARRAEAAGFDLIELHMAHGYLLSSFLSPAANTRTDGYGGSLANRCRFPLEVFDAVRAAWPADRPLAVRVSASDWLEHGGTTLDETVQLARQLAERGCGLIDVSSGGNTPASEIEYGRMYQVPFAERIKREVDIAVMAVGAIQGADHANTVLATGRADLCALARPHLVDPHLTLRAAVAYDYHDQWWPPQYLPARPRPT